MVSASQEVGCNTQHALMAAGSSVAGEQHRGDACLCQERTRKMHRAASMEWMLPWPLPAHGAEWDIATPAGCWCGPRYSGDLLWGLRLNPSHFQDTPSSHDLSGVQEDPYNLQNSKIDTSLASGHLLATRWAMQPFKSGQSLCLLPLPTTHPPVPYLPIENELL